MFTAPYEEVDCPKCQGSNEYCELCQGSNLVDPDKAQNYELDHRESFEEDME